jgi:stage III sporulation protein AG
MMKSLMKNDKAIKTITIGCLALFVLFFLSNGTNNRAGSVPEPPFSEYEKQLEEKLMTAISAISGVGELTVVVTLDSLSETVYAERGNAIQTVITPRVRGVAVICEGGDNVIVKQKIIELVSRVLGISSTRISVTN